MREIKRRTRQKANPDWIPKWEVELWISWFTIPTTETISAVPNAAAICRKVLKQATASGTISLGKSESACV